MMTGVTADSQLSYLGGCTADHSCTQWSSRSVTYSDCGWINGYRRVSSVYNLVVL